MRDKIETNKRGRKMLFSLSFYFHHLKLKFAVNYDINRYIRKMVKNKTIYKYMMF